MIRPRESHYYKYTVQAGLLLNVPASEAERLIFLYGQDEELKEDEQVTFHQDKVDLITHDISVKYLKRVQAVDDRVLALLREKEKKEKVIKKLREKKKQEDERVEKVVEKLRDHVEKEKRRSVAAPATGEAAPDPTSAGEVGSPAVSAAEGSEQLAGGPDGPAPGAVSSPGPE